VVARTPTITRLDRASSALPFSSLGYLILASASALLVFLLYTRAAFLHAAIIFGVSLYCLIFPTPGRCTTSCLLRLLYFALHITKPHLTRTTPRLHSHHPLFPLYTLSTCTFIRVEKQVTAAQQQWIQLRRYMSNLLSTRLYKSLSLRRLSSVE